MNGLLTSLYSFCATLGLDKTYWIAFSAGLDSSVLLALCHELTAYYPVSFNVVHIDHRLHAASHGWARFAKERAEHYALPFVLRTITDNKPQGVSLEAYARDARYTLFKELLQAGDVVLTAHHEDDQAETVLLQLMRGAGVKGLAAMPAVKPLGKGLLGRPLLTTSRDELLAYAKQHRLPWIDDHTNQDPLFARNYIRHNIMPLFKAKWPKAPAMLARAASHCALTQEIVDDYLKLENVAGSKEGTLSARKLLAEPSQKAAWLIRQWIIQGGAMPPDIKMLRAIQTTVLQSRWDRVPVVSLGALSVRRYRDDLYLTKTIVERQPGEAYRWQLHTDSDCELLGLGRLVAIRSLDGGGEVPASFTSLDVRFLPPSATIAVFGRSRQHSLKKLYQEWGVPPWLRHCTPLLFANDELIGVPGYYWSHALSHHTLEKFKIAFHMA